MGRVKTDYLKNVIYKITCDDKNITDFYVGGTTNFVKRKNYHKRAVINDKTNKIYETIRANGGWENWSMTEIEIFPCKSSVEARIREEYWRVELQASLNMIKAHLTKEEIRTKQHEKYLKEIEKVKEYNKQYRENPENKVQEKKREYREKNIEKIKEKKKIKYTCECGSTICKEVKARHERSQKHILNMAVLTDQSAKVENK